MISCYLMSLLTLALLVIAFLQSIFKFHVFSADHVTFMILTSIVYLFTETLVIFFYVGTGVSIRDYTKDHGLDSAYHKRSIAIKRRVYPPLLYNMLFMIIVFILVGAVDTNRFPMWAYQLMFFACIFHYVKVKALQNSCFRDNTQIILDMAGIDKKL
jgi:hypothetical protein